MAAGFMSGGGEFPKERQGTGKGEDLLLNVSIQASVLKGNGAPVAGGGGAPGTGGLKAVGGNWVEIPPMTC